MSDAALYEIAREITLEHAGGSKNWHAGCRVRHPDGRLVQIISGYYLDPKYSRVSNWWTWRAVNEDGSLAAADESGYGWNAPIEEPAPFTA
jgi:hypothetical protein